LTKSTYLCSNVPSSIANPFKAGIARQLWAPVTTNFYLPPDGRDNQANLHFKQQPPQNSLYQSHYT
jgi:hypothetical protein